MYEKIIEIIVYVISELRQNKNISEIDVNELQKRGYTSAEISTALSWLVDRVEFSEQIFIKDSTRETSFRILHEAERELFTKEAWGELVQLQSLGILTNEHIDTIIERALMLSLNKIDSPKFKTFVAMVIFNPQGDGVSGNRIMLNGSDAIN